MRVGSHGQWKFITYPMEMPISYNFYAKVPPERIIGKVKEDVRKIISTLFKYKNVDVIAGAVCRSCTFKCGSSAKIKYIEFYGMFERKKHTDALGQTSGDAM